jgi:hypothetical protein
MGTNHAIYVGFMRVWFIRRICSTCFISSPKPSTCLEELLIKSATLILVHAGVVKYVRLVKWKLTSMIRIQAAADAKDMTKFVFGVDGSSQMVGAAYPTGASTLKAAA